MTLVRKATAIVEEELAGFGAFQCMAILHEDRVTGMRNGKRDYGHQIEVRCWDSDGRGDRAPDGGPLRHARAGSPSGSRRRCPGVVSVTYNVAAKPPSTMEAV